MVRIRKILHKLPYYNNYPLHLYSYKDALPYIFANAASNIEYFPCIVPGWDNTPRYGKAGEVLTDATPELFQLQVREAIRRVKDKPPEHKLIFVRAWNEWAEGNYIEPDIKYGRGFLEAISKEVSSKDIILYAAANTNRYPTVKTSFYTKIKKILDRYVLWRFRKRLEKLPDNAKNGEEAPRALADPSVSIIVLNWNGREDTLQCLRSLEKLTYKPFDVILVDNGSTGDSVKQIRSQTWAFLLHIIENGKNLGYAEGNNVGIRYVLSHGTDYIMILNNDTIVAPDMLDKLVSAAQRWPKDGIFGPRILYMDKPDIVWQNGASWDAKKLGPAFPEKDKPEEEVSNEESEVDGITGAALFFRSEVPSAIGLFDKKFFLVYEESDWCWRAKKAGYACRVIPSAKVWHKVASSFDTEASPLRAYFSARNILLLARKNLSLRSRIRLLLRSLRNLTPRFTISQQGGASLSKRIAWSYTSYLNAWKRISRDPIQQAKRAGVRDYLFRRFGDCPGRIREINRIWAKEHKI
jgi:hypothetical protein